jgi:hypothetical protein
VTFRVFVIRCAITAALLVGSGVGAGWKWERLLGGS